MTSAAPESPLVTRARRTQGWGLGLLTVAALLWVWFAVLLLTPYEQEGGGSPCPPLLTSEYVHHDDCVEARDWPGLLALLGGSVPFAAAGAALYAAGAVTQRFAEHLGARDS
ncbi:MULTISPECIES: hypothetical protein [unclassified Streptomyces]|jgi:hypothetical protein|uniref:hypothetical protein n=1 Tax=unclassified Streptomyces TaxID=2593676 RepID=UPI00369B9244